jgi:hypothetical protein
MKMSDAQVGDTVTRMLAGIIPMELVVDRVDDDRVYCGPYVFDRETGAEIDEELGWGAKGCAGSILKVNNDTT